jgi:hypothetical protein
MKTLKLTGDQLAILRTILLEVQKTVEIGDVQEDGEVYANYENYLLSLSSDEVNDLNELLKSIR